MVKHKKPWGRMLPVLVAFLIGGLLFSTAIVIAYKVGNDQNIKQNKELSAMLNSINATPAANLKTGTPSAVKTPSIAANTAPSKNNDQILKDCLAKIEVFKSSASKLGYSQSEIDGLVPMAEYNCNHSDNKFNLSSEGGTTQNSTNEPAAYIAPNTNNWQTTELQNKQASLAECQKKTLEYTDCIITYNKKMFEYTECQNSGNKYCYKPSNYCYKPICL